MKVGDVDGMWGKHLMEPHSPWEIQQIILNVEIDGQGNDSSWFLESESGGFSVFTRSSELLTT